MEFHQRLQDLRKKRGMTQELLAEKLGVTRQTISKWERGESTPDFEYLIKISEWFQVPTDYLLKGELLHDKQSSSSDGTATEYTGKQESRQLSLLGACLFLGGSITNIVLFVLSIIYDMNWTGNIGSYIATFDGFMGFLFWKDIVWLFALMCLAMIIGLLLLMIPFIKSYLPKYHNSNSR